MSADKADWPQTCERSLKARVQEEEWWDRNKLLTKINLKLRVYEKAFETGPLNHEPSKIYKSVRNFNYLSC